MALIVAVSGQGKNDRYGQKGINMAKFYWPRASASIQTWGLPAPALEGMAEACGFAVTELFGNQVDGQLGLHQQVAGLVEAHLVKQLLEAGVQLLQVATQRARRAVQAAGYLLQTGAWVARVGQVLADLLAQVLTAVELRLQLQALQQAMLAADRVGQRQWSTEQGRVEAQGIAAGAELHRAAQQFGIAGAMQRAAVIEQQTPWPHGFAEQVLDHGQQ